MELAAIFQAVLALSQAAVAVTSSGVIGGAKDTWHVAAIGALIQSLLGQHPATAAAIATPDAGAAAVAAVPEAAHAQVAAAVASETNPSQLASTANAIAGAVAAIATARKLWTQPAGEA